MAGVMHAMMDHALVGGLHKFWINDVLAGEITVSAAVAGAYGVPTILVTSDTVTCNEAEDCVPGIHTYCTKDGFGRYMGRLKHPSETGPGIEQAAKTALEAIGKIPPYVIDGEVTMRAEFRSVEEADLPAQLEGVTRIDGYILQWTRPTFLTAHRAALSVFNMSIIGRRAVQ
jgi:D-amino peptidase